MQPQRSALRLLRLAQSHHAWYSQVAAQPLSALYANSSSLASCSYTPAVSSHCPDPAGSCSAASGLRHLSTSVFNPFGSPESKRFTQRRLVGWSPDKLYKVVSEVQHYNKFVPWCQRSVIVERSPDGQCLEAELEVGFQMLVERYVSHVVLQQPRLVQSSVRDSMLFHHLDSSWGMEPGPSPNTTWLTFHIDFAFNNALYGHLADVFFSEVVKRMMEAFEGRCHTLYGQSSLIRPPPGSHRPATNSH